MITTITIIIHGTKYFAENKEYWNAFLRLLQANLSVFTHSDRSTGSKVACSTRKFTLISERNKYCLQENQFKKSWFRCCSAIIHTLIIICYPFSIGFIEVCEELVCLTSMMTPEKLPEFFFFRYFQ